MIAPQGPHKHTAEAMRQDSAEITPEQIEDARKLVAKYPSFAPAPRPPITGDSIVILVTSLLIGIVAGYALTGLALKILHYAAPWLR